MANETSKPARRGTSTATKVLLLLTAGGLMVFLGVSAIVVWLALSAETPDIKEGTWLRVVLAGTISDSPTPGDIFADPEAEPQIPSSMARAIRKAGTDDRIKGIYFDLRSPSMGFANTEEMRDALVDFKASGKPCVTFSEGYDFGDYWLASACDEVVLAPSGISTVMGIGTSITYYQGTFEWLGITADFEHVGDFKSAVEPYERSGPSEPASLAMNEMFDSLYDRATTEIATGRGKTQDEVKALIDDPPMSPQQGLSRGLFDAVGYRDAVEASLDFVGKPEFAQKLAEVKTVPDSAADTRDERFTYMGDYLAEIAGEDADKDDQIAVVYAEGPIMSGSGSGGLFSEQMLTDGAFQEWMTEVREDDSIKAIVLRVNSPGGSGLASDNMWREIELAKSTGKPVVVSMSNYAASGGYYIACNSDWIVAEPTTLTGSIGVFGGKLALGGAYGKLGMTEYEYKRGDVSDLFSQTQPFSDHGRTVFRGFLEDFYQSFLQRVADGRHKTKDDVHTVAQGRVWTGTQALDKGLVDELGGLDKAIVKAASLGGTTDYGITKWPRQKGFFDLLAEDLDQNAEAPTIHVQIDVPVPGADQALHEAVVLDQMLQGNGIAAYDPSLPKL